MNASRTLPLLLLAVTACSHNHSQVATASAATLGAPRRRRLGRLEYRRGEDERALGDGESSGRAAAMTSTTSSSMRARARSSVFLLPCALLIACSPDNARIGTLSAATTHSSASPDSVRTRRILADSQSIDFMDGSVSRDGRFVTGYDAASGNLVIRDLRSDEQRTLTSSGSLVKGDNALTTRISPDGRMVAFLWSFGAPSYAFEVRVIGTDGSRERVLRKGTSFGSTIIGDWTPDSRQIVVSASSDANDREIAVMSVADGSMRTIKSVGWRYPGTMRVSPDGRRVAYAITLDRGSSARDIYMLELDGTREVRLTSDAQPKDVLGWSEDGRTLYYQTRSNDAATVWRVSVSDRSPAPSPQLVRSDIWGLTRLALHKGTLYYAVTTHRAAIYSLAVDFESGRVTAPSSVVAAGDDISMFGRVAWSPDGRIAFVRNGMSPGDAPSAIVFRDLRSGEEHQMPVSLSGVQLLDWPRDGRSLSVAGYARGVQARYRIDLGTGKQTFLDRLVGYGEIPQASPSTHREYVVRMDSVADSTAIVAREAGSAREVVLFRERRLGRVVLSPDGKYVGVVGSPSVDGRSAYVAIIPAAGGPSRIVHRTAQPRRLGFQVDWTPDSRFLAFVEHTGAHSAELWKVGVSADSAERVTTLVGTSPAYARISPDGHHVGYVSMVGPDVRELWAMENLPGSRGVKADRADAKGGDVRDARAATSGDSTLTARRLSVIGTVGVADVAPDGSAALVDSAGTLRLSNLATGASRLLVGSDEGWIVMGRLSHDGARVFYARKVPRPTWDTLELRVRDIATGQDRVVRRFSGQHADIEFGDETRDGAMLVLGLRASDWSWQLARISLADGAVIPLKSLKWRSPGGVRLSPDGRFIAYDVSPDERSNKRDVYVLATDGSREVDVTRTRENERVVGWTRDGSGLLFTRDQGGSRDLVRVPIVRGDRGGEDFVVRRDVIAMSTLRLADDRLYYLVSNRPRDVVSAPVSDSIARETAPRSPSLLRTLDYTAFAVSPDGARIAYVVTGENAGNGPISLFVRTLDTGDERELELPLDYVWDLEWTSQGQELLAVAQKRGRDELFRIDLRTAAATLIPNALAPCGGSPLRLLPVPAPNGATTYYVRQFATGAVAELVACPAGGGAGTVLHRGELLPPGLSASPDGKHVALLEHRGDTAVIHFIPTAPGEPRSTKRLVVGMRPLLMAGWVTDGSAVLVSEEREQGAQLWRLSALTAAAPSLVLQTDGGRMRRYVPALKRAFYVIPHRQPDELWVLEQRHSVRSAGSR